jgi:hypothetical protein
LAPRPTVISTPVDPSLDFKHFVRAGGNYWGAGFVSFD